MNNMSSYNNNFKIILYNMTIIQKKFKHLKKNNKNKIKNSNNI